MNSTATLTRETDSGAIIAVCACGATLPPAGECLAVGLCADADAAATAGAGRVTAKYAVPAAWNVRGGVD
jgi:hypothetical protein